MQRSRCAVLLCALRHLVKNVLRSRARIHRSLVPWCKRAVKKPYLCVQRARHAYCVRAGASSAQVRVRLRSAVRVQLLKRKTGALHGESSAHASAVQSWRAVTRGVQDPGLRAGPAALTLRLA